MRVEIKLENTIGEGICEVIVNGMHETCLKELLTKNAVRMIDHCIEQISGSS
jgi:hypothetical protein